MKFLKIKNHLIFLDIDGTITADNSTEIENKMLYFIENLQKNNKVYLCTNSRNHYRNQQISKITKLEILKTTPKKPSSKILNSLSTVEREMPKIVIGDKFLTDRFFARNIGAEFILVKRILSGNERFLIKTINFIDDLFDFSFGNFLKK